MYFIRDGLLAALLCFHVLGAAVIFRRIFPRENPWMGYFIPPLVAICLFNFIEHFIALPELGWLLPVTLGGILWGLIKSDKTLREGLYLPGILFLVAFSYIFVLKCLHPAIPSYTEAIADLSRMANFCLGEKVPPTDSWLPPYVHDGYYTFQHYGASLLKRLFMLDIGTGYNLSFIYLNTLACLIAAAVAFSLSGRKWIAASMILVVIASFTGAAIIMMFFGRSGINYNLAYDLHHGWADAHDNPLWQLLDADPDKQRTRLWTPAYTIYLPEFHATVAGNFLCLLSLFCALEVGKVVRSNWAWILLLILPFFTIVTSTWYLPIVGFICAGGLAIALGISRRPLNPKFVGYVSITAFALIWPTLVRFTGYNPKQGFHWTLPQEHTYPWVFAEQWWPVYIPWLLLFLAWPRMSAAPRILHLGIPAILVFFEYFTIGDRELTLEKIWSAIFTLGLVSFVTLLFMQKRWYFRIPTAVFLLISLLSLRGWWIENTNRIEWDGAFRLQGDQILGDPQKSYMLHALKRLHGKIILGGRPGWGYSEEPAIAAFSENRTFLGWTYHEEIAGNGEEPHARAMLCDEFYTGKMADPLSFLSDYDIAAVIIWPNEKIPDAMVAQLKDQLKSGFYYVDCKLGGPDNAGVFFRKATLNR